MTIDILSNTYRNNVDTIFLISGDGDYIPIVEEVMRYGKKVYVAALSSGLNRRLRIVPDMFMSLMLTFLNQSPSNNISQGLRSAEGLGRVLVG
jgi:uncharacterized LabA/DUF88 family protein